MRVTPLRLALAFGLVLPAPTALAQSLSVGVVNNSTTSQILGNPMAGGVIRLSTAPRSNGHAFHFEVEMSRGRSNRVGPPCGGFILPGTCADEPLQDDGQFRSLMAGASLPLFRLQRLIAVFTTDLAFAAVRSDTRGLSSGGQLRATENLWGGLLGVHTTWAPFPTSRIALELGGAVGALIRIPPVQVLDGYTPFEGGLGVRRWRAGLSWQP